MGETAPLPLSKRPYDILLAAFFIVHIPIALLFDSQSIFPEAWFPVGARKLVQWHVKTNGDYLVGQAPPYFRALVICEIVVQLPLHFALAYALLKGKRWGRMTGIVYGVHTATTMPPILSDILESGGPTRNTLLAIYLPYLLIPLLVVARFLPFADPFAAGASSDSNPEGKKSQ